MKVFVYGSLKKGFHNHYLLEDSVFVATDIVDGYSLVDLGSFPMALPDPEGHIIGEIYYITPETLIALDRLESEGTFYNRIVLHGDIEENLMFYVGTARYEEQFDNTITKLNFWNKGFRK